MNYQILILAFLLVFTLGCALRAALSPLGQNIRRFIAIPIAFLICYLLQKGLVFSAIGRFAEGLLEDVDGLSPILQASPYLQGLVEGTVRRSPPLSFFPSLSSWYTSLSVSCFGWHSASCLHAG